MRIQKVIFCPLLITALICGSVFTVHAEPETSEPDAGRAALSQQAYTKRKEEGRQTGKPQEQVAREAMIAVGFPAGVVNALSPEKLRSVYLNQSITTSQHYLRVTPDGSKTELSPQECKAELALEELRDRTRPLAAAGSIFDYENVKSNAYVKISMGALSLYDKNYKPIPGEYAYYGAAEWLKMPVWRGTDILGIASSAGAIRENSGECITYSRWLQTKNGSSWYVDYNDSYTSDSGNYDHFLTALSFRLKLPSDSPSGLDGSITYTDMEMLVYGEGIVPDKYSNCNYNVSAQYFHQKRVLISSLSVNLKGGVSISVSPSFSYDSTYPRATIAIQYYP